MIRIARIALCLLASVAAFGTPRISYERVLPPLHNLGGDDVVVIYLRGAVGPLARFVETFSDRTNRSGDIRLDLTDRFQLFSRKPPDEHTMKRIRREFPRDVYLAVDNFVCDTIDHEAPGSMPNGSGERVNAQLHWADAVCRGEMQVLDSKTGAVRSSFPIKGEGTSPRVTSIGDEERGIAARQAGHFAGVTAAASISPRHIREAVELDDSVPEFDQMMLLIDAGRLSAARRLLEVRLRKGKFAAALHYDIGAICEAMADLKTAERNYQMAAALAPHERRYSRELKMFRRRTMRTTADAAARK